MEKLLCLLINEPISQMVHSRTIANYRASKRHQPTLNIYQVLRIDRQSDSGTIHVTIHSTSYGMILYRTGNSFPAWGKAPGSLSRVPVIKRSTYYYVPKASSALRS